ncbi:rRNA-processing arch domain-containing protein [Entophlyctis helioformis]|nr:rRNA-processing arch domain-containing protein [Entophlyctis helioformis]
MKRAGKVDVDDLFGAFSDSDEDVQTSMPIPLPSALLTKRSLPTNASADRSSAAAAATGGESSSKRHKTSSEANDGDDGHKDHVDMELSSSSLYKPSLTVQALQASVTAVVADDFDQNVEKEYAQAEGLTGAGSTAAAAAAATGADGAAGDAGADGQASGKPTGQLVLTHQVRHQVAVPPGYDYVPLAKDVPPENPARTYPFKLDPFQQTSVICIERSESVLVSAHTSAGKTVVAEYAIAKSLRDKQRVIYTSPIKALSNQKYRELQQDFGDVGLMTGDVTINANASCLVMTTEILRSMLYRGSEVMREIAWVIFDEIHYMRDKSRGVVWEETLILLPDKVRFVFLSATIPNAMQFAEWIVKIHKQPCHVVYTDYRPTPLQHYLFPSGGEGIYLAVDEKGTFREDNFQKAIAFLGDDSEDAGKKKAGGPKGKGKRDRSTKGPTDLYKILKMIMVKNYHPVIVFSFSKRECEANALQLSKLDFNDDSEKELVKSVFENAILPLSEDDRGLPQIEHILPLLKRGIGIHHSGLLPILKEVIEILFQEGLLKVLFATETFSIGLNMPAKTVVFTSVRKFDGKETRWLSGGEYIQMSGRAGRRGLDDRGIVILMIDEKMEPDVAKGMVKGVSDALNSAFHLTYTMILNLLRIEGVPPEHILQSSFFQYQNGARIPQLVNELQVYEKRRDAIVVEDEELVSEYYQIRAQLDIYKKDMREVLNQPAYTVPFLQPGRLVHIVREPTPECPDSDFGWGMVVNFIKPQLPRTAPGGKNANLKTLAEEPTYIVDVLLHCAAGTEDHPTGIVQPGPRFDPHADPKVNQPKGSMVVVPCLLSTFNGLSVVRANLPKDLKSQVSRNQILSTVREIERRFKDGIPLLDPIKDMKIEDEAFQKLVKKIHVLEPRLFSHALHKDARLPELYAQFDSKMQLAGKIKAVRKQITDAESILQLDELKARRRILRRLGYTSDVGVIEIKGRVACEISAGDELVLTELIFNGVFNDLSVEQTVALLSCFAFGERASDDANAMREELKGPLRMLQETARRIAKVSQESKLALDEDEYVASFRPDLMDVVYAWCEGAKFSQICKMTDVFEGSIIRGMRRLEELLRQLVTAAKSIGNVELETKFSEGIVKIKRDIVFAASLYL